MPAYNPTQCYNSLKGSNYHPCPNMEVIGAVSYHCMDAQESGALHDFCSKNNMYVPFHWFELYNTKLCAENEYHDNPGDNPNKCQPHVFASYNDAFKWQMAQPNPDDWSSRPCECCCSCYAYGTPIAIPGGYKAIEKLAPGESVLAGSLTIQDGDISVAWSSKEVRFSDGTPPQPKGLAHYPNMVYINYDDGKSLIVTLDEIFLLKTGKIKRAGTLTVHDELVSPDGKHVKINSVMLAEYSGGIHHISTDTKFGGSMDGHLLNSNGVVSGDYILQIYASKLGDLLVDAPVIGSVEYHQDNAVHALAPHAFAHAGENTDMAVMPKNIKLYTGKTANIPVGANAFFTDEQAIDILANPNIKKYPFSYKGGLFNIEYIFKIYNSFYPDIRFYVDWENTSPNAYAFWEYGEKHVIVSGELARLEDFYWQGMAVVLAQCIASFYNPAGENTKELLPKAKADYYGVGLMMRVVWPLDYFNITKEGLKQVNYLFDAIPAEDAKGNPKNPLGDPSLDCRRMTMQSGFYGGELPKCAGGSDPKPEKLMVAYAQPGPDIDKVTIAFTKSVDKALAEAAENYTFKPEVNISDIKVDEVDRKKVVITADFQASTDYAVTVQNLIAADGSILDTSNNFAFFTTGE